LFALLSACSDSDCTENGTCSDVVVPGEAYVSASLGNDANPGSKAAPYATISQAVTAGAQTIFICAEAFTDVLVLESGVSLLGGRDCMRGWQPSDGNTTVDGSADSVTLTIGPGAGESLVEGMTIVAPDALGAGMSSIAVLVHGGAAAFSHSELVAGRGATGMVAQGESPDPDLDGATGSEGHTTDGTGDEACSDAQMSIAGGAPGTKTCGLSVDGGHGGLGRVSETGGDGDPGDGPKGGMNGGEGGMGEAAVVGCGVGGDGADGDPGIPGPGASGLGSLSAAGYEGVSGERGMTNGQPGAGGGGGGGARTCNTAAGPSGGGGGSGGCGGNRGFGGGPGGSSMALVSVESFVRLSGVSLTTSEGGEGGIGGGGQLGGEGGEPGAGVSLGGQVSCRGGFGGHGGRGGAGGGGRGGHSTPIAFLGSEPMQNDVTFARGNPGPGGRGGDGGSSDNQGGPGDPGLGENTLSFAEE
jgi:hypothetical protein